MRLAPIVLFVYNRPWHTKMTLTALKENYLINESDLIIYSDGPKEDASESDVKRVTDVRNLIYNIDWCNEVKIVEREKNLGLANSIISGVTEVVNKYGKIIVLEDDIITSNYFLKFMNDALIIYENEKKVASISGYVYPLNTRLPETFFLKLGECWGWSTWQRAWNFFVSNGRILINEFVDDKMVHEFNFGGNYPFFQMLLDQINQRNDSWAICWYASIFIKDFLTLYPGTSLVDNVGFDGSGIHCNDSQHVQNKLNQREIRITKIELTEDSEVRMKLTQYFGGEKNNSNAKSIMAWISKKYHFLKIFLKQEFFTP